MISINTKIDAPVTENVSTSNGVGDVAIAVGIQTDIAHRVGMEDDHGQQLELTGDGRGRPDDLSSLRDRL